MKKQLKSMAVTASAVVSLLAITFSTAAAGPAATNTTKLAGAAGQGNVLEGPVAATSTCTKVQASDAYFVTLTEEGDIDAKVDSYPVSTTKVTAAFDYNCIPKKFKLNIVWSIDGQQVLTDNQTPKPTDKANSYTDSIFMKDGSALPDGTYSVEFYTGEDLLTSGEITVGGEVSNTTTTTDTNVTQTTVTVQGTIVDSKSKKAITGALVVVLNDGVDAKQWLKDGKDSDVMAFAKTDSKGQFELNNQVPVDTPLPWIIGAKGYKTILQQDYSIDANADDPYILNIALDRQK